MFNGSNNNKSSGIKSIIGGLAKNKLKGAAKKLLITIMIPWGALICAAIFIIIFCIGAAKVGFMGNHTFSDTMNKYDNKLLEDYLKVKVENANGPMDDYYGMAKRVALTEGNVEGFISLAELETGKDINKMIDGKNLTDLIIAKLIIDKYSELLAPNFNYKQDFITTTTTTYVTDSSTGKTTTSTSTSKQPIKLLIGVDAIKGKVDITYKNISSSSTSTKTETYTIPKGNTSTSIDSSNNSQSSTSSPAAGSTNSNQQTATLKTTVVTKVDTPTVDNINELEKKFERLKGIIQKTFKDEDTSDKLAMAVHYVIQGTGSDYDNAEQDGDWINSTLDYDIVDDIMGALDGGFGGDIPLFRQTDPRWANIAYGEGDIATSGCGPTSFAMIVSGLGGNLGSWDKNKDGILDPGEAAAYSKAEGYNSTTGEGTSWALFDQQSASRFGLNSSNEIYPASYEYVYNELKNGYPVVASMHKGHFTGGGHFIVLTGVDTDGQVLINDPNPATGINKYPMKDISDEANAFWVFSNPNMKFDNYELTVYGGHKDAMEGLSGITADGTNVNGYVDFSPRIIAVDPSVIPLKSKVYIKFPESIRHEKTADGKDFDMNGLYTARDTGGAFHGGVKHIDLFMGYGAYAEQMINKIGTREVKLMKR